MSDTIATLRNMAASRWAVLYEHDQALNSAADEIESLQRRLSEVTQERGFDCLCIYCGLRSENFKTWEECAEHIEAHTLSCSKHPGAMLAASHAYAGLLKELLRSAACPNKHCENGVIRQVDTTGDWCREPCQWCAERDAALAKNPTTAGADSPASATTDPSGEQDKLRDAVTTAALPLNAPLATPGAQSAPSTNYVADRDTCPSEVTFANGRRVKIVRYCERCYLDVDTVVESGVGDVSQ